MKPLKIPANYNYISAFLTFACNFSCHYCINKYGTLHSYDHLTPEAWGKGLNRIKTTNDRPITLTGGEPTLYKGFYDLVAGINSEINLDLLTNGSFDVDEFMKRIPPYRMKRDSKYASIRFSFHPDNTDEDKLVRITQLLQECGYSVGVWSVDNGDPKIEKLREVFGKIGIDYRTKEYLDETHGTYKYPKALDGIPKNCMCKPSELLIAPDGRLFRCHYDLYHGKNSYGHILDPEIELPTDFLYCENYGLCNPCDVKLKFDRFQEHGHSSVEIKEI
jgi:hypothetical protein